MLGKLIAVALLTLLTSCHLVFPHSKGDRSANHEQPTLPPELGGPADSLLPDGPTPDGPLDWKTTTPADLPPVLGTDCTTPNAKFSADVAPKPGATLTLTVCLKNPSSTAWMMGGVKTNLKDGKGSCCSGCYAGGVQTIKCVGYDKAWTIPEIKVPNTAGPYAFSLLADCESDQCNLGTCKELAWCKP